MNLTFDELKKANKERSDEVYFPIDSWALTAWSNALAGEVGEVCNLTKKHLRDTVENKTLICDELADVVIYADLLAQKLKVNLGDVIRVKFNKTSAERGSAVIL